MKNFKILCILFSILITGSCEKDENFGLEVPSNENADHLYLQVDENGDVLYLNEQVPKPKIFNKNEINPTEYRIYEDEALFTENCSNSILIFDKNILARQSSLTIEFPENTKAVRFYVGVEDQSESEFIRIIIYSPSGEIIYQERIFERFHVFRGFTFSENIYTIRITHDSNGPNISVRDLRYSDCEYVPEIIDSDGDGVPDDEDLMPNSNMEETVMIEGCDSMVENIPLGDGIMLSDVIDELEVGDYKNHGQYTRATAQYLAGFVEEGVISQEEMDMIMECAGSSSLGM